MKSKIAINISFIFLITGFFFSDLKSQIKNLIVVKVGTTVITSVDVQNEILTNLLLNKVELTQENINNGKSFAIQNLISKRLKRNEIEKYEVTNYDKNELIKYTKNIAKSFDTNISGLKKFLTNTRLITMYLLKIMKRNFFGIH